MNETTHSPAIHLSGLEYYRLRDYLGILVRRKWLILSCTFLIGLVAAVIAYKLPNQYRATTVILVDPRKVPDSYVVSTVTSGVADRLATLRQQILSSTRLSQVIDEMNLYAPERNGRPASEEIVDRMRRDINVEVVTTTQSDRGLGAFRITYENADPLRAAKVTNRLASLFIEQNIKQREQQVLGTADFIDKELEDSRKGLEEKENQIRQMKAKYVSDLPESETMHIQALTSLQLELRSETEAASRAAQQIVYLQGLSQETYPVVNLDNANPAAADVAGLQQQLGKIQSEIDQLRSRYGPEHPDVLRRQADAEKLEQQINRISQSQDAQRPAPVQRSRNPVIESQIAALRQEVAKHEAREKDIRQQLAYHQGKLERIPLVEQQIASVMRDYESAQTQYQHLLDRKFSADMSSDLESKQKGERFVVLDPAQVPDKPFSPNRLLIDLAGLVAGLLVGLGAALALEVSDTAVKTEREVADLLKVSVLSEVPWIRTGTQVRESRIRQGIAFAANAMLALVYIAIVYKSR